MEESNPTKMVNKKVTEVKTFPVPFALEEIKENISNTTNTAANPSKEQIINQAFKFHSQGNIQEAAKYYQYFIDQGFNDHKVFSNYGVILKNLGKSQEAEISYRKAIELNPNIEDTHLNLGNILSDLGKLQEAEISYRKAIEINADFANAHLNLGNILSDLGNLEAAEVSQRKAIELNPDFAIAHSNLGNILRDLGKLQEAEISYRKAIELNPDYIEASLNLSLLKLLQGDYENGLETYESRFQQKKVIIHSKPKIKKVATKEFQKGEKLLVLSEQGLGDTLQYMRYIPYLRTLGLDLTFSAQTKLHSLIKASSIDNNPLTPEQANTVLEGKWISLLSLPKYLKINPSNPIISKPYIFSTVELKKKWNTILSKEKRPIIGINWQGNPKMEKKGYKGRSIPLERFSILLDRNDITMLSLQKGFGSEQLENCSFKNKFVECQQQIDSTWDFLENAAIIENCDLIITCDTSIAHLAGGMGKKVWLMLRDIPYWTWGLEGDNTFWYPSMKLFRQAEPDNWHEVMERVASKLNNEITHINPV